MNRILAKIWKPSRFHIDSRMYARTNPPFTISQNLNFTKKWNKNTNLQSNWRIFPTLCTFYYKFFSNVSFFLFFWVVQMVHEHNRSPHDARMLLRWTRNCFPSNVIYTSVCQGAGLQNENRLEMVLQTNRMHYKQVHL